LFDNGQKSKREYRPLGAAIIYALSAISTILFSLCFPSSFVPFSENFEYTLLYFTIFSKKVLDFIVQMHLTILFLRSNSRII